ncbi:hypothetical protein L810_8019 [Burkholderia sp. AU4i]|nr:hypothetical protein L810_8019 [Burkholderia sp. AU4i]MDW9248625.1 hypothetical protein [Burkholderia cepacia]
MASSGATSSTRSTKAGRDADLHRRSNASSRHAQSVRTLAGAATQAAARGMPHQQAHTGTEAKHRACA